MRTSLIFLSLLLCLAILCGCAANPAPTDPTATFTEPTLYIMNVAGVKIITVLEETVKFIQETPNALFCVMADDSIIQTDYSLSYRKTIYEATRGPSRFSSVWSMKPGLTPPS